MMTNGDTPQVVMVTGGSGLVGQAIRMYVEQSGARENESWVYLSSKDGDIRNRKDTEAIFEKYKPTRVIHLAAKVGGLFANMAQKVSSDDGCHSFGPCLDALVTFDDTQIDG
jgi:GDP-L-fucose synthase